MNSFVFLSRVVDTRVLCDVRTLKGWSSVLHFNKLFGADNNFTAIFFTSLKIWFDFNVKCSILVWSMVGSLPVIFTESSETHSVDQVKLGDYCYERISWFFYCSKFRKPFKNWTIFSFIFASMATDWLRLLSFNSVKSAARYL